METRVGQLEAERVLPVDAGTYGIGGLSIAESLFYRGDPISVVTNDGGARCGLRKIASVTRMMADVTRAI
jgi:hypothetical protein